MTAFLIIDVSLMNVTSLDKITSFWSIVLFVIISIVYAVGQYFILAYIARKLKDNIKTPGFGKLRPLIIGIQVVLVSIVIVINLQILLTSQYTTALITWSSTIGYTFSALLMSILSVKFLTWYLANRNFVVLLYAISSLAIGFSMIVLAIFTPASMLNMPGQRYPYSQSPFRFFEPGTPMGELQYISAVCNAVAFLLLWVSTAALLRYYSSRIGRLKFWIVMSIPIISFTSQYVIISPLYAKFSSQPDVDMVLLTIFGNVLPGLVGGIIFGVPFWLVSRKISANFALRDYMVIASIGLVLLQITTSSTIFHAPYPVFGLASVLFTWLSCYLMFIGLYYSAVSVSIDTTVRQILSKSVRSESSLIQSMGFAQMEQEIRKKMASIAKKHLTELTEESGIEPELSDREIKEYIQEVIEEVKDKR